MALSWTDFNNGESLLTLRNSINSFNNSVVTDVNTNTTAVSTNASNISTLDGRISTNEDDIASLSDRVTVNEADILTNVADIVDLNIKAPFIPSYDYVKGANIVVTDDTYEEVARMTTTSRPAGIYKLSQSMLYSLDSTNTSAYFRFSLNGGSTWSEVRREPKDNTDVLPSAYTSTLVYAGGVLDWIIQARKEDAGDVLNILSVDMIFERKV